MTATAAVGPDTLRRELCISERNTLLRLSPGGEAVAYVQTVDGRQRIQVRVLATSEERTVATLGEAVVGDLLWTADGEFLVCRFGPRGRDATQLAAFATETSTRVNLPTLRVRELWLSRRGHELLVAVSDPKTGTTAPARLDLGGSGVFRRVTGRGTGYHGWLVDGQLRIRGGTVVTADGSVVIELGDDCETARPVLTIPPDSAADLVVVGFDEADRRLLLLTSARSATRRLVAVDARSGKVTPIYQHPDLDIEDYPIGRDGVWFDPRTGEPDICCVISQRIEYQPLNLDAARKVAHLDCRDGPLLLLSRNADDTIWLVVKVNTDGPIEYATMDTATGETTPLFVNRPGLIGQSLPRMEDFSYRASDGLLIGGYLLRANRPSPQGCVVLVHGGPASRDYWRFHATAQYLASLGLMSLHVNFRGSRGFGTAFRKAGHREWGGRMQQDLYDSVTYAVEEGMADPGRVALFGSSYGGYAALLGACTRPDLIRCAVAVSPPCDLIRFALSPSRYWQPLAAQMRHQIVGDIADIDSTAELRKQSPLHSLNDACAPLLIAHGTQDPRVPVSEVDTFVNEARRMGVDVTYLRFEDEGHEVKSDANHLRLFEAVDTFMKEHMDND